MKVLLLGRTGQVGLALQESLRPLGSVISLARAQLDLCDVEAVRTCVRELAPQVVVNAAAYTAVDQAEAEPAQALRVNVDAVAVLANAAIEVGALLVHYSTDYVFDGTKDTAYVEEDTPRPLNVYGRSKLLGEIAVRESGCDHLVLRTGWVYSACGTNFPRTILRLARERATLQVVNDQFGAPTSARLLAAVTASALRRWQDSSHAVPSGLYHVSAAGATNWHGYAVHLLQRARARGMDLRAHPDAVAPVSSSDYGARALRPRNSVLCCDRIERVLGVRMPAWEAGLEQFLDEVTVKGDGA